MFAAHVAARTRGRWETSRRSLRRKPSTFSATLAEDVAAGQEGGPALLEPPAEQAADGAGVRGEFLGRADRVLGRRAPAEGDASGVPESRLEDQGALGIGGEEGERAIRVEVALALGGPGGRIPAGDLLQGVVGAPRRKAGAARAGSLSVPAAPLPARRGHRVLPPGPGRRGRSPRPGPGSGA